MSGDESRRLAWKESLLRLNAAKGVPSDGVRAALPALIGPDGTLSRRAEDLAGAVEVSLDQARLYLDQALAFDAGREAETAARLGVRLVDFEDPAYPQWLKATADAPLALYVRGTPPGTEPAVAVVGSRRPTPYGLRMAAKFAGEMARAGVSVVSGLARGIDTQAHRAALAAGGGTWAVLGCGLDQIYPPENEGLAREIAEKGGGVLSELPFGAPPLPFHFPRRNRIISGLCWGTIVIEGRARSGSLITAHAALEQGREVFAVPGPADSPLSEAPHELISQGAALASTPAAVLAQMPEGFLRRDSTAPLAAPEAVSSSLSADQRKILQCLGCEALTLDELSGASGLPLPRLASELFELELGNVVSSVPGQRYAKKI